MSWNFFVLCRRGAACLLTSLVFDENVAPNSRHRLQWNADTELSSYPHSGHLDLVNICHLRQLISSTAILQPEFQTCTASAAGPRPSKRDHASVVIIRKTWEPARGHLWDLRGKADTLLLSGSPSLSLPLSPSIHSRMSDTWVKNRDAEGFRHCGLGAARPNSPKPYTLNP